MDLDEIWLERALSIRERWPDLGMRAGRALDIVMEGGVERDGEHWLARSQSTNPVLYHVSREDERHWRCACADHGQGQAPLGFCKHILAVMILTDQVPSTTKEVSS